MRRLTASLESVMPAQYGLGENKPAKTSLRLFYLPFMLLLALACTLRPVMDFIRPEVTEG